MRSMQFKVTRYTLLTLCDRPRAINRRQKPVREKHSITIRAYRLALGTGMLLPQLDRRNVSFFLRQQLIDFADVLVR